jgi:hypothetical protein
MSYMLLYMNTFLMIEHSTKLLYNSNNVQLWKKTHSIELL